MGKATFLPTEFVALIVARRPHAIHIKGGSVVMESYDVGDTEFKTIAGLEADPNIKKDSTQSAKTGVDTLIWMPSIGQFGFIHLTATSLDNVGEFIAAMPSKGVAPKPVVISSTLRENKRMGFKWYVPRATVTSDLKFDNPTPEQIAKALELFRAPRPQGRDEEKKPKAKKGKRKSK